jgi:preprotein translocase subunit SecF
VSFEIVPAGTHIDFIGKRRICGAVSAVLLLAGAVATLTQGVKLGIDFAGGTEMHVKFLGESVDEGPVRDALADVPGIGGLSVVRFGASDANEFLVRFQTAATPEGEGDEVAEDLRNDSISAVTQKLDGAIGGLRRCAS